VIVAGPWFTIVMYEVTLVGARVTYAGASVRLTFAATAGAVAVDATLPELDACAMDESVPTAVVTVPALFTQATFMDAASESKLVPSPAVVP
jgi:hypothetical protein